MCYDCGMFRRSSEQQDNLKNCDNSHKRNNDARKNDTWAGPAKYIEVLYTYMPPPPPIGLIVIDRGSPTIYTRQYNSAPCVPYAQSCISRKWKHKGPLHVAAIWNDISQTTTYPKKENKKKKTRLE